MTPDGATRQPSEDAPPGGVLAAVEEDSLGARAGLQAGDRVLAVNDHPLRDELDFRFYAAEPYLLIEAERDGRRFSVNMERSYGQRLGLTFAHTLFDGLRQCDNHCPFCFVAQMPPGLRPSLYVRDDDYRYSFLHGNFVTLTNLSEADWLRIEEQHLSPLYVSIHATPLEVRRRMLGRRRIPDVVRQIERLGEIGIAVHGQIVIVPGMNDGEILERSVRDLLALWPTLRTLALVPVGLTRYHRPALRLLTPVEAEAVLDLAERLRPAIEEGAGTTWLYPSDELYLLAGHEVPEAAFYASAAQRENGVGLVRELLDDWQRVRGQEAPRQPRVQRATLACGTLVAPILTPLAGELGRWLDVDLRVVPVRNRFLGDTVTVSGLLAGGDVLDAFRAFDIGERLFLPRLMFGGPGHVTLDDMTASQIEDALGVPLVLADGMSEIVTGLALDETSSSI